eukprot:1059562-Alexandrium_andersonii.AAC.1
MKVLCEIGPGEIVLCINVYLWANAGVVPERAFLGDKAVRTIEFEMQASGVEQCIVVGDFNADLH